jgi:hypothetical protein
MSLSYRIFANMAIKLLCHALSRAAKNAFALVKPVFLKNQCCERKVLLTQPSLYIWSHGGLREMKSEKPIAEHAVSLSHIES